MTICAFGLRTAVFVVFVVGCAPTTQTPASPRSTTGDFDRGAALTTLSNAAKLSRQKCSNAEGPHGTFRVAVVFGLEGPTTSSTIEGPFESAPGHAEVRGCVERIFRDTAVPPYHLEKPVTVHKTFVLD